MIPAIYSAGLLTFTSTVKINAERTVLFRVTSMKKAGELIGIQVPSYSGAIESDIFLQIYSSGVLAYVAQLGRLTLTQTQSFGVTLNQLTKAAGETTAWEFTITSLNTGIDSLYIQFPTVDDYGSPLFDADLGVFSDKDIVPCGSSSTLASLTTPECIFFTGSTSLPATILVRGFQSSGTMILYIAGAKNPAIGSRLYMDIKFYAGSSFNSKSRALGYVTESSNIPAADQVDDTLYFVDGITNYISGSYGFRTPFTIPSSSIIMVKLDPACTIGRQSGIQYFLSGNIGNYALMKTTAASPGLYSFNNFICQKSLGLSFLQYNMMPSTSGGSNGERRIGNYIADDTARQGYSSLNLVNNLARVSTNIYGQTGMAKFNIGIGNINTLFNFNGKSMISSDFVITMAFQNYYFDSISTCSVYYGLDTVSPNAPVQCNIDGVKIIITNFKAFNSDMLLELTYTNRVSYSGSGTLVFKIYGSPALLAASDFAAYSTITLPLDLDMTGTSTMIAPGSLTFTNTPIPGTSQHVVFSLNQISLPSTLSTNNGESVKIGIERGILSSSTTCTVASGSYTGCSVSISSSGDFDYIVIPLLSSSSFISLPAITVTTIGGWPIWPNNPRYLYFQVLVKDTGGTLYKSNSMTVVPGRQALIPVISMLHLAIDLPNELSISVIPNTALDPTRVLSCRYYDLNVQAAHLAQIDCVCSSSAQCYNYIDGSVKSIDIIFTAASASTNIKCYIPNLLLTVSSNSLFCQILSTTNRAVWLYSAPITITSYGAATSNTHSLDLSLPSPVTGGQSFSTYARVSSNLYSYQVGSYAYSDFGLGGPIYLCGSVGLANCRSYTTIRNILVISIDATQAAGTSFDLFSGTATASPKVSSQNSDYYILNYITYNQVVQSQYSTTLLPSNYLPQSTTVTLSVDQVWRGLITTQKITFITINGAIPANSNSIGGKIEITVSGITGVPPVCYASCSNKPIKCALALASPNVIMTLTDTVSIPSGKSVEVYFSGKNPTTGAPSINLAVYSFYDPGQPASAIRILRTGTILNPSYVASSGAYVPISSVGLLSFITKSINLSTAPIRIRFRLSTDLQATIGKVTLTLPSSEYSYSSSGSLVGYFRSYSNEIDFIQKEAYSISISGTLSPGYIIVASPATTLTADMLHELVVLNDLNPQTNSNFGKLLNEGKSLLAVFDNSGTQFARGSIPLYTYKPTSHISITGFQFTSTSDSTINTLVLSLVIASGITAFPASVIEIEFPSASNTLINVGLSDSNRQLQCGVLGLDKRTTSVEIAPRCTWVPSYIPKIRIENYASKLIGANFVIILYDLLNNIIPKSSVNSLDMVITYTDQNLQVRSRSKLTRAFTAISGPAVQTITLSDMTTSVPYYGEVSILTQTIVWPTGMDCTTCQFVIRGWDWQFTGRSDFEFRINGVLQTIYLDLANNAFVVMPTTMPLMALTTYTFTFSGPNFRNPLPIGLTSNNFIMDFSNSNQYLARFVMTPPYSSFVTKEFTGTTDQCVAIDSRLTGAHGGAVACYLDIPVASSLLNPLTLIKIGFSQHKEILPYCEAYFSSGPSSAIGGQLSCLRAETSTAAAILTITGFNFVTGSRIRVFFRARLLTDALTATIVFQANKNGVAYAIFRQVNYNIGVTSATSILYNPPTLFKVQNFAPTRALFGATSPFRIVTTVETDLTTTASIAVTHGLIPSSTMPQCLLRSITNDYPLPIINYCAYDSPSSTFTLRPLSNVIAGRYLLFIGNHQSSLTTDGVTFPGDTSRLSVKVALYSTGFTLISQDLAFLSMIADPFNTFTINPQRNLVGSTSSQLSFNLLPSLSAATAQDSATSEVIFVLELPTPLYDSDLGISAATVTGGDYNGMQFPTKIPSALGGLLSTLHYGASSSPAQVIFSKHSGFPTTLVTISFPLLKNPSPNSPLGINVYLLSYPNGQAYATVLYRASYTNYFYTLASAGETSSNDIFRLSNPFPQQTTSIIFQNKYYGSVIDQNVKIYVKLKNAGRGFETSSLTNINCPGYTVEWYKKPCFFYLIPNSDVGSTPTITCSGFKLVSTIETLTIETGCHQSNNYLYQSEQSIAMSALNSIPSSSSSVTRVTPGLDNRISVNRYQITLDTSTFILKAGGYLLFVVSPGFAVVPGLSEYISVSGLSDKTTGSPPASIQAIIDSGNLKVSGYNDYSGVVTFNIFLRNMNSGSQFISFQTYDQNQSLVSTTVLPQISVSSAEYAAAGSIASFLTDAIDVFVQGKFRLSFKLEIRNALTYATSSKIIITGAAGFSVVAGICKYRLSTDSSWKRSPCAFSSLTATIPIIQGFDISAGSTVYVLLTSEDSNYILTGVQRPSTTTIRHVWEIKTQKSGVYVESAFLPMILYPVPNTISFTLTWYTQGAGDDSLIEVKFTTPIDLAANTFFQLDLVTNDEISSVFPVDLGTGTIEKRVPGNCAEHPSYDVISNNNIQLKCFIQQGRYSTSFPSRIIVQAEKIIPTSSPVRFYIAKIKNPGAIPGGYVFSVMTPCRDDGYGCPIYRQKGYTSFGLSSPKTSSSTGRASPKSALKYLLDANSLTTFTFPLTNPVTSNDAIVVKTNTANIVIGNICAAAAGTGMCLHFPKIGWTFFQPSTTISASSTALIKFTIDNAEYYDRTNTQDLIIEPWSSGGIQQRIASPHPDYLVQVPSTVITYPTQSDPSKPYIISNFDNIIAISISDIWRTNQVKRIVINAPSSYAKLSDYCMAGINLDNIGSTTYTEFPCKRTSDREITIMINDPSKWSSLIGNPVLVYFRGFAGSATGLTSTSAITSFTDVSLPYVLDEYTGYSFNINSMTAAVGDICAPGVTCNLCYKNVQCPNELLSYCTTVTPRSCQPCQDDSHCSHITDKPKCLTNSKCVECLISSDCSTGMSCINNKCTASGPSLQLKLSHTGYPDTYLIEFPPQLVANTDVLPGLTITLVNISPTLYTYTLTRVSDTVFRIRFTVTQSIPITKLHVDFTHPTYIPSYYTAEIPTKRMPYITETGREASETIQTIGTITTIAMAAAAGSLLVLGSNPALFWAIINLIQTFYYLIFINVDYPANVQFFLNIFTMAGFDFVPNPMTWFDPNIDEESLPVPARFEEYDVNGLFLNNVGNILLIWAVVLVIYFFSTFGNRYLNRPSRLARIFFAKMVGWFEWNGLLRTLMTSYPDIAQAAFLQLRVLTFRSGIYSSSSLFGTIFAIYGFVFPFLTILLIKKLSTGKVKGVKKYKALTEEYSSKGKYSKYFSSVFLAKWLLIMMSLVFLHDYPYIEITILTIMSLVIAILLAKFKPYETERDSHIRIVVEFLFFIIHLLIGVLIYDDHHKEFSEQKRLDIGWAMISLGGIVILIELGVTVTEMVDMIKENWKLFRQVVNKQKAKPIKLSKKSQMTLEKSQDPLDMSDTISENISVIESSSVEKSLFIKSRTPPVKTGIIPEKNPSPNMSDISENLATNEVSFTDKNLLSKKSSSKSLLLKTVEVSPEKHQNIQERSDSRFETPSIAEIGHENKSLFMKRQLPKLKDLERSRMLRRPMTKEEDFEKKLDL